MLLSGLITCKQALRVRCSADHHLSGGRHPASRLYLAGMAYIRYVNRELDESNRLCLAALESDGGHWFAHWVLSWTLLAARDAEGAARHAAAALAAENVSDTDAWASLVCMARGEIDRGFQLAAAAVRSREVIIPVLLRHLLFAEHRADSRYTDLLASIGRMNVL